MDPYPTPVPSNPSYATPDPIEASNSSDNLMSVEQIMAEMNVSESEARSIYIQNKIALQFAEIDASVKRAGEWTRDTSRGIVQAPSTTTPSIDQSNPRLSYAQSTGRLGRDGIGQQGIDPSPSISGGAYRPKGPGIQPTTTYTTTPYTETIPATYTQVCVVYVSVYRPLRGYCYSLMVSICICTI